MALMSGTSIKSLDINEALNVVEHSKDALIIYDFEILDGILCEEIIFVNVSDGFNISFSSQSDRFFELADYYFDSENNSDLRKKMDEIYSKHKNKRKFRDKIDEMDVHISVRKRGPSWYALLMFRKVD